MGGIGGVPLDFHEKYRSCDAHGQRGSHETISTRPLCEQLTFVIVCAMCFPHVKKTNIKIESLFFGGSETSTLLEWGRWTEAGDKEGARGVLGAFLIHPRRVPRKEQTKTVSALGAHPCHPCSVSFPREVGGKKVNDKTSTEQRIRHK